jgi:Transcriptional regulatory protein, C terminal
MCILACTAGVICAGRCAGSSARRSWTGGCCPARRCRPAASWPSGWPRPATPSAWPTIGWSPRGCWSAAPAWGPLSARARALAWLPGRGNTARRRNGGQAAWIGGLVEFRLLGPLEVVDGGQPVPIPSAKHRVLLAYLLVRPGELVTVDELAEVIWGDALPANPRTAVQTYVSRLRQRLPSRRCCRVGRAGTCWRQRSPTAWRQGRAASASSGVNRSTHRSTVTWSTSTPRSTSSSTSRQDRP